MLFFFEFEYREIIVVHLRRGGCGCCLLPLPSTFDIKHEMEFSFLYRLEQLAHHSLPPLFSTLLLRYSALWLLGIRTYCGDFTADKISLCKHPSSALGSFKVLSSTIIGFSVFL